MSNEVASKPDAISDRLGFLLARHGRIMNVRLRQALGVTGLGPLHAATLMRLVKVGATSQQELIEVLATDASALVSILNNLEGDGLVERRRDPIDRRRHIVESTPDGVTAVCAVERAVAEVEQEALAALTAEEVEQLHTLLSRLRTVQSDPGCAAD